MIFTNCLLLSPSRNFGSHVETVKEKERSERTGSRKSTKLEERLHEAGRGSCGRILFWTSIRPADGKLISARKITNGRRNTSGGNLPAGSVRLAKNRLLAPAVSIGPNIIAAITGNRCPSERLEEAKSSRLMSSSYVNCYSTCRSHREQARHSRLTTGHSLLHERSLQEQMRIAAFRNLKLREISYASAVRKIEISSLN